MRHPKIDCEFNDLIKKKWLSRQIQLKCESPVLSNPSKTILVFFNVTKVLSSRFTVYNRNNVCRAW